MKLPSKLTKSKSEAIQNIIMEYSGFIDDNLCLQVSDGKMRSILKEKGYDVSVSYVQRTRKLLRVNPYNYEYTKQQVRSICEVIMDYTEAEKLTVTDAEMSKILNGFGFSVNIVFVQRLRNKLGIRPRGNNKKFTEEQLYQIHTIIKKFTRATSVYWQLTVSDAEMSRILNERGFTVSVVYVERTRRSLGILPLGERGGTRPGAGRPSISSLVNDPEYASLINLHNQAVTQLSYRQQPSGALRGQSGADIYDKYGHHTISVEDAVRRKAKILHNQKVDSKQGRACGSHLNSKQTDDIEVVFTDEVNKLIYGKMGKGGGVQSVMNAQANQIRYGQ